MRNGVYKMNIISQIWAIITSVAMLLTTIIGIGPMTTTPSSVELVKTDKLLLENAMYTGQGITTDGEYYYTSGTIAALGATGIAKWKADDYSLVASRFGVIPEEYKDKYECNHVGGVSYYDGLIYAAVENKSKDGTFVITYDCETLDTVSVYEVECEALIDGIPWCAVDSNGGYLYCSPFHNTDKIVAFDLETMEFSHYIMLSESISRIQGGEEYNGKLYLSSDNGENTDTVYSIDIESGEVQTVCERTVPGIVGNEAEGLTVFPMSDGSLIHVIDYDKTVGISIRHYSIG